MKKFALPLLLLAFSTITLSCAAQSSRAAAKTPRWLSDNGWWVIEHNKKTPKNSVVYFYNNNRELVYQEKVTGVRLNINRKKTLLHLNQVLTQALAAWERDQVVEADRQLVRNAIKRH